MNLEQLGLFGVFLPVQFHGSKQLGRPICPADEMIAGHAVSMRATLVTNNLKHFDRVPGLMTEGWL